MLRRWKRDGSAPCRVFYYIASEHLSVSMHALFTEIYTCSAALHSFR
jgi:hypothetical protein